MEKGAVADWFAIGYSAPGTGSSYSYGSGNFNYAGTANTADWNAYPQVKLNDCAGSSGNTSTGWKMIAALGSNGGLGFADNSSTSTCVNLTPSWGSLSRASN